MTRWQRLRIIAWAICYRCGLRPSEVLNLRIKDFQLCGKTALELLVRVKPKSERGKRRVPASLLLSEDESRLLIDYYHQRRKEMGLFGDNYLLAHPDQKSGRLSDEDTYEQTRSLLRTITGDDTVLLYHARHTFNSSLEVQLQLRGKPLFNQDNFLPLDISVENDKRMRALTMGNECWGRKDQHVQAILVGHSSPEITNIFYNHLNDVLLGSHVRQKRDKVPVSLKTVMALSGLRQSRANELLVENDDHPLSPLVKSQAMKYADKLLHPLLKDALPLSLPKLAAPERAILPPWEQAASEDVIMKLQRGESNWSIAYEVYEGVRKLDSRRISSVAGIIRGINDQLHDPSKRWRGPTYTSITELRTVLSFLTGIRVARKSIILAHHSRRGQSEAEQAGALLQWQERVGISVGGWISAEMANATAPKKGLIEIRVVNPESRANKAVKQPAMSRGFEVAIKLIAHTLSSMDN